MCAISKEEVAAKKIRMLLSAESIDEQDKDSAIKSLSETCMPKRLTEIYLSLIYKGN